MSRRLGLWDRQRRVQMVVQAVAHCCQKRVKHLVDAVAVDSGQGSLISIIFSLYKDDLILILCRDVRCIVCAIPDETGATMRDRAESAAAARSNKEPSHGGGTRRAFRSPRPSHPTRRRKHSNAGEPAGSAARPPSVETWPMPLEQPADRPAIADLGLPQQVVGLLAVQFHNVKPLPEGKRPR